GSTGRTYYLNSKLDEEKAIGIITFFNWMVSEEAELFFSFGIEGETYTVENGKVNYTTPSEQAGLDEEFFRTGFLWLVQDITFKKRMLELTDEGKAVIEVFDTVLANEGRT